jgi:hypothetical protein
MTVDMVRVPVLNLLFFFIDESVIKMQSSRYKIESGCISEHNGIQKFHISHGHCQHFIKLVQKHRHVPNCI